MNSDDPDNLDEMTNEVDTFDQDVPQEQFDDFTENTDEFLEESDEHVSSEPIKANKKLKTAKRGGGIFSFFTFLIALAALAASAYTYWQQLQLSKTANVNLTAIEDVSANLKNEMETQIEKVTRDIQAFSSDNEDLVSSLTKSNRKVERDLKVQVDQLSDKLFETDAQIVGLKGFSDAAKYAYIKAEIEYFLQTANNRIDLAQDSNTALAALEAADERLGLLVDPSLRPVRAQVLDEIQELKAVEQPDTEKLALTLSSIAKQVPSLTLRMDDDKDYFQEEIKLKEGTGFRVGMSNVWRSMKGTLDKLVEVRDATPSDVPLMSVEDQKLLYINLDVQLQSARLASLKGDTLNYRISIEGAEKLLSVYFDTEKPKVNAVIKSLADIKDANLSPELPDITQSLIMLRQLRSANSNETSNE